MDQKSILERCLVPLFIAAVLFFGVSLVEKAPAKSNNLKIFFMNVGQGDASLIKTPNHKLILIDGGPDKAVLTELGKVLTPGENEIDKVILTHPHADHLAGLNYVLERYKINKIYLTGISHTSPDYITLLEKIKANGIPAEKIIKGKKVEVDGASINFLWPPDDTSQLSGKDLNTTSAVFELGFGNQNFLFLGDLPAKEQRAFVQELKEAAVVKISHHGSKTALAVELIERIKPIFAVISVGAKNDYGHPAPSTIKALGSQKVLRTDQKGTVIFETDGNVLKLLE